MFASLAGLLGAKLGGSIIIDVNGVGYSVIVADQLEQSLQIDQKIKLQISTIVREDAFLLFGFETLEERRIFETLRSVNGVGPKLAMSILADLGIQEISNAVANQDDKVFTSVSGIGAKTAKLLTVSLEGKLGAGSTTRAGAPSSAVLAALVGLGWREAEAVEAIAQVTSNLKSNPPDKELLRLALSALASSRTRNGAKS